MRFLALSIAAASFAALLPAGVLADAQCSGRQLLSKSRPEASCRSVMPEIFVSPDKTMRAVVLPADVSLDTTPDMESRVVIRSSDGETLTSKDHSSPRGMNGYYVYRAKWSPDSQFFVYSLVSSGGHSPWQFPIMVYSRKANAIAKFSDMIDAKPTLSGDFNFAGPHTLTATTWKQPAAVGDKALNDKVPISVDLEEAFKKLPSSE
jgi:hypothetical protein